MSLCRSSGGLGEEDFYFFRVYKILVCEGRIILHYIFIWGCPRDLSKSFRIHAREKLKMSCKMMKNFDKTMLAKMDSNPSGDEFDMSLLNACIMYACPDLSSEDKELYVKPIKDFRNIVIHDLEIKDEATMEKKIKELRDMLTKAIQKAGEVYGRPNTEVDDIIQKMDDHIDKIRKYDMDKTDIASYQENIAKIRKEYETMIKDKGVPLLKENFKYLSNVDPASWISGRERLSVKMVFTRLDMIKKAQDVNKTCSISLVDILELETEDGKHPTMIVVEGEAGSGKSTLAKFILADWADLGSECHSPTINGLENYDLVLYAECKNRSISSFPELLLTLLPHVSYDMMDRDLVRSVEHLRTLVVIDGLDEINDASEKLLDEMITKNLPMSGNRMHFIITTRPHKVNFITTRFKNIPWVHTRITGIPVERRVEFVKKLHDEMVNEGQSKQSTDDLVDYMKQSQCRLGEHYRLPLNLTFLTYLWASDPATVHSVTSATRLYVAVLELLESRFISRMHEVWGYNIEDGKVKKFVKSVFAVYLDTHKSGLMQLSDKSLSKLKHACEELELPFDDVSGAFFRVDSHWTYKGNETYLSAPHKSIMEFFSAFHIFNSLIDTYAKYNKEDLADEIKALQLKYNVSLKETSAEEKPPNLKDFLQSLLRKEEDGDTIAIDFSHYQNVLLHLGGLLALKKLSMLHECGEEIVHLLHGTEITEAQWLDLVAEAECDPKFTSFVAKKISKVLVIRDGHTGAALEIFKVLDTSLPIQVILETEVRHIPKIEELMDGLSKRDCAVEILLKNHWKNPMNGTSTNLLEKLLEGDCVVTRFTGNIGNLEVLPHTVENIRLTLANDKQAEQICNSITALEDEFDLKYLGVHVTKDVSPAQLKPLPILKHTKKESGTIWLSGIDDNDIDWASSVSSALLQEKMHFNSIMLPRCNLSQDGFENLLKKLKDKGVSVSPTGSVKTDSTRINKIAVASLREVTRKTVNCNFHCGEESDVW